MVTLKMASQTVLRNNEHGVRVETPTHPDIEPREHKFKVSAADSRRAAEILRDCIKRAVEGGDAAECDPQKRAHANWGIYLFGQRRPFYQTTALPFGLFDKVVQAAEAELAVLAPARAGAAKTPVGQNAAVQAAEAELAVLAPASAGAAKTPVGQNAAVMSTGGKK